MVDFFIPSWIEARVEETVATWKSRAAFSQPCREYSQKEQRQCERAYDEGLRAIEQEARRSARVESESREIQNRMLDVFARFCSAALGLNVEQVELLTRGFFPVGIQLARWTKSFDPNMGQAEIVQACRNAWTACGMQPLLGERMELTPSILGYSLLYPYSDNYLDREDISTEDKLRFSSRFRRRLCGEILTAWDNREAAIWTMVALIEEQYPREMYPQVYECLLAIHSAQERSIAQLARHCQVGEEEILRTTIAKGGSSVLADASLVRGKLNENEAQFAFEWGALLQLGDDLQDLHDDMRRGSVTLLTHAALQGIALDGQVRRLLDFGEQVVAGLAKLPSGSDALKNLLRMSWRLLILGAVADTHKHFSPPFLQELERSSPFRFDFLRVRKKRVVKQQGLYVKVFDLLLQAGNGFSDVPIPSANASPALSQRVPQELAL